MSAQEVQPAEPPQEDPVRRCTRCVVNESVPNVRFDATGVCSVCAEFQRAWPRYCFGDDEEEANLQAIRARVKRLRNRRSDYDVIIGLSGGVDSSYLALLASRLDLDCLAVHFDNGWNSKTAVSNIRRIVDRTGFDLETIVVDWPEFRDLQRAYLKAGVIDFEAISDHAISAAQFSLRRRNRIATIFHGGNYATEHGLPREWTWPKRDWKNIQAIHRRYGERRLRTYPHTTSLRGLASETFGIGGTFIRPLNQINYRKGRAMDALEREFEWEDYGGKHHESVITKFYQSYILPKKFGVDKRIIHYSALVRTGEMSREDALDALRKPAYTEQELRRDKGFVVKKLGFSEDEFDRIMNAPPRSHRDFATDQWYVRPMYRAGQRVKYFFKPPATSGAACD